jgi:hypothetical protein
MNHAGQALRTTHPATSEPDWWFGYGDTQLCAPTIYLYVPPRDPSSPDLAPSLLNEVFKAVHAVPINAYQDGRFQKYAIKAINDTPARSSKKPPVVLSLSRGGGFLQTSINSAIRSDFYQFFHQFSTCAWSQYCDKIEVVLTSNPARKDDAHCQSTTPDPNALDFLLITCDESAEHIRLATSAAQTAFLYTFELGGANIVANESAASSLALATAQIPREYSSNNPKNAIGSTSLNLENKVLFYDDFESVEHVKPHVYEGWGPSFTRFNGRGLGESMLAFGPSLGMTGCTACNIDLRVGILDWHESAASAPLDSVFTSFIYHPFPPKLGRAVTGNFRVDAGFQGLWDGPQRRNVFVGGGFGFELQFGRYVIEMVATRDYHWNSQLHFTPTTTLSIGVRIPSISLSRSPT